MEKKKIEWLSILQGWSMLLVVIGHVSLTNVEGDPSVKIYNILYNLIYSFHMQLFMFISGFLFYSTRIIKNLAFQKVAVEKIIRFGIPLLFFTSVTILPKILLSPLMKRPVALSCNFFIDTFILYKTNPLGEMWFIISLTVLMMLYSLFQISLRNIYSTVLFVIIAVVLFYYSPATDIFQLRIASRMLLFFYGGILFSKYNLKNYFNNWKILPIIFGIFILSYKLNAFPIILKWTGILFSFSLCINLAKQFPKLFTSFRDYTYQIYLMAIFFQVSVRLIYSRIDQSNLYWLFVIISIFAGIYVPTLIGKIIKRINNKYLNTCFGL